MIPKVRFGKTELRVTRIALGRPALSLTLLHNGKEVLRLAANQSRKQRIGALFPMLPMEPPDPAMALLQHPRVVFTPHLGASTGEAQVKVAEMIANQMASYLLNDVIVHAVNFPSVSREVMAQIKPWVDLAEKMGALMGQMVTGIHNIAMTFSGDVAELETRPLTHAALKGFLGVFTDKPVNFVNARAIAKAKGIKVKETLNKDRSSYTGTIRMRLEDYDEGPNEIWGTIFGDKYPRIVRFGKIYMDAIPEGSMIIIQNIDKPGVIGNVGTTLGKHDINIGRFQLGRLGDRAVCMVNIDAPADDSTIEDIRALPNMVSVKQVHLR